MSKQPTHLKSIQSGRVFLYTEILAGRPDMVACDAQGNIMAGHIADADGTEGPNRKKTKYLGSLSNGGLYPYTDVLAQRSDMVSVDSLEEWEIRKGMQSTNDAPILKRETAHNDAQTPPQADDSEQGDTPPEDNPGAGSSNISPIMTGEGDTPPPAAPSTGLTLPNIEGLGAREAKNVLAEWAETHFQEKLNRGLKLEEVVRECQTLLDNFGDQAQLPPAVGLE